MQQAIKKKLFSQNKIQVKKRRLIDPLKKTVKELLREKREDLNMSLPLELKEEKEGIYESDFFVLHVIKIVSFRRQRGKRFP